MPFKRITNCGDLVAGFVLVDSRQVEISVGIKECNFSLKSLLNLIEMNLNDWKRVIDCKIERFSSGDFIKFDKFRISHFNNSDYI